MPSSSATHALFQAIENLDPEAVQKALASGADLARLEYGRFPLGHVFWHSIETPAQRQRQVEIEQQILEAGGLVWHDPGSDVSDEHPFETLNLLGDITYEIFTLHAEDHHTETEAFDRWSLWVKNLPQGHEEACVSAVLDQWKKGYQDFDTQSLARRLLKNILALVPQAPDVLRKKLKEWSQDSNLYLAQDVFNEHEAECRHQSALATQSALRSHLRPRT